MTLVDLDVGETAEIRALKGDAVAMERIRALGLHAGRKVRFVKAAPFSGPLLIEDATTGVRVAIAREMAEEVEVRRERAASP